MTKSVQIGSKPSAVDRWVAREDGPAKADLFTARLTIDVTPALRARIKLAAFGRGLTVAEMLRAILEREFQERVEPHADSGVTGHE